MPEYDFTDTRQSGIDSILRAVELGERIDRAQWQRQREQELDEWERQKDAEKARIQAIRYMGEQNYAKQYRELIDAGVDEDEASRRALWDNAPDLFVSAPEKLITVRRELRKPESLTAQPTTTTIEGETYIVGRNRDGTVRYQHVPKTKTGTTSSAVTAEEKPFIEYEQGKIKNILDTRAMTQPSVGSPEFNAMQEEMAIRNDNIRRMRTGDNLAFETTTAPTDFILGKPTNAGIKSIAENAPAAVQAPTGPLAVPATATQAPTVAPNTPKSQREPGKIYSVNGKLYQWTGTGWIPQ